MKQNRLIKFCLALVLAVISGVSAFAQNEVVFSFDKPFVTPGETTTVALKVKTTTKITAFSGRINLPEGLTFVSTEKDPQNYEIETTEFSKKADISLAGKTNKSAAFIISKLAGFKASNEEVELARIKVKAADDLAVMNTITCVDFLGAYAYDAYEQGEFTSTWYNANYEATPTMADFSIKKGETKKVAVALNFDKAKIHSLQLNFVLPEGLTIDEDSYDVTERDTMHQVLPLTYTTGVAVLAPWDDIDNRFFTGTEGNFITFDITAAEDFKTSQLKIVKFQAEAMGTTYFGKDVVVNVTEGTETGINGINGNEFGEAADGIYQLNGVRTDKMQHGVNIVVKDGKAVKVVKK